MKKKVISVVGARPNFMKVAPIHLEFEKHKDKITHLVCHTGQHYDEKMSKVFFDELGLPKPDFYLGIGSGSHAIQTAGVMIEFEKILLQETPDLVIVVGDVNSTIACSLVAKKMNIPVAHIEAGLRSFDRKMPEEINRILTDAISDYLFVSEQSGLENLEKEGVDKKKIFFVGNIMIDSLVQNLAKIEASQIHKKLGLQNQKYIVATLHRPANVDEQTALTSIIEVFNKHAERHIIVFPVHPRTKAKLAQYRLEEKMSRNIVVCDPIGYLDFIFLIKYATLVLTDSGGIQEETTFLKVPCLTLRDNTERPVTVQSGTNTLVGTGIEEIDMAISKRLDSRNLEHSSIPPLWDGKTAMRICEILIENLFVDAEMISAKSVN